MAARAVERLGRRPRIEGRRCALSPSRCANEFHPPGRLTSAAGKSSASRHHRSTFDWVSGWNFTTPEQCNEQTEIIPPLTRNVRITIDCGAHAWRSRHSVPRKKRNFQEASASLAWESRCDENRVCRGPAGVRRQVNADRGFSCAFVREKREKLPRVFARFARAPGIS